MTITAQSADGVLHQFPDGTAAGVVDQAMKSYASDKSPSLGGTLLDSARSIPGGLLQGATSVGGMIGNSINMGANLLAKGAGEFSPNAGNAISSGYNAAKPYLGMVAPTSDQLDESLTKPFGGYYQPKTSAGKFVQAAASFAPAAFGGEASIPERVLGRVLAPAAGSMVGGSAADAVGLPKSVGQVTGALVSGGLASGLSTGVRALTSAATPEEVANTYITNLLKQSGTTPDAIDATGTMNLAGNRGMTAAEAIGPSGVSALGTLGRRSGTVGADLANTLQARAAGASDRMLNDIADASGIDPQAAQGNFDALLSKGQAMAGPLYKQAFAANQNVASPEIDRILSTPAGRSAMRQASDLMQNDQTLMGVRDPDLLEQARDSGTDIPWNGGVSSGLKLQSLDYVKRALDDQIGQAFRAGNKTQGSILSGLKNRLLSALDDADQTAAAGPNSLKVDGGLYAQARKSAGDYLSAQQAFKDGQAHILSPAVTPQNVATYFNNLTPVNQEAYKGGLVNKLFNASQNGRLRPSFVGIPAVQQKLAVTLGPWNAHSLISNIGAEAGLAKSGARMMPNTNSITPESLFAGNEQDHAANIAAGINAMKAVGHVASGNPFGAIGSGIAAARHFVPDLLKTGIMNSEARAAAGRQLMMTPSDFAANIRASQIKTLPSAKTPLRIGLFGGSQP